MEGTYQIFCTNLVCLCNKDGGARIAFVLDAVSNAQTLCTSQANPQFVRLFHFRSKTSAEVNWT